MAKTTLISKSTLEEEITAAFDGVSRGNGVTLHQAVVRDDYGSPEEEEAARARDSETRWQDVPYEDIETTDAVLSFLDAEGFRYYLPAYMLWYLDYTDPGKDDTDLPEHETNTLESLNYHLAGDLDGNLSDYQLARFATFTPEQSRVIARFVLYMAELNEFLHRIIAKERIDGPATAAIEAATWEEVRHAFAQQELTSLTSSVAQQNMRSVNRYWGQFLIEH